MIAMNNAKTIGWIEGLVSVFIFLGINQVVSRYCSVVLEVNPVVYSCAAFSACALMLILFSGPGALVKETIRSVDTWTYGVVLMLSYVIGMILYGYVTSTELTMLQKVSVFMSFAGSWFFLGRKPDKYQLLGTLVITVGVATVAADILPEKRGLVYFLAVLYGAAQAARIFIAEIHRPHTQASTIVNDPRARARVIGFVMLVVSSMFLLVSGLVAFAQVGEATPFIRGFPMLEDFSHPESIFAGVLTGIFLIAPLRVLEFSSSQKIKTENFITILTFMSVSTLFWEWATAPITGLSIKAISGNDLIALVLITAGGLITSLTRKLSAQKSDKLSEYLMVAPQNLELVDDSREIVANTLEKFEMDIKKSAKALGVPKWALEAILADGDKVVAFKNFNEVSRRFRTHVSNRDGLTGLLNRGGFMVAFKKALNTNKTGAVLYIDLDKFKPVNDTHGHDAGDEVLQRVARRLEKHLPAASLVTRMGGDEYCAFVPYISSAEMHKLKTILERELAQPYALEQGVNVEISASIGTAHYPEEGKTPADLINSADKGMYGVKHADL